MSSKAESRRKSIGMTSGSLWKNIFLFSIPLMCSQILEVLFNLSDVAIVGKYAGYIPLGSVGSTTLLVSLFTGFLIGMGIEHATLELELKEEHCDGHCDCCEEQQGCDSDTQPYL